MMTSALPSGPVEAGRGSHRRSRLNPSADESANALSAMNDALDASEAGKDSALSTLTSRASRA